MICFDTNMLVYAIDRDTRDRHARASALVERAIRARSCIQPLQTLCEFFHVATRKMGLDAATATIFVEGWQAVIPTAAATPEDLGDAMRAVGEHGLSFWDALLWATTRRIGARLLVSEDFQDGRTIEGVRIVNPFVARNAAIVDHEIG